MDEWTHRRVTDAKGQTWGRGLIFTRHTTDRTSQGEVGSGRGGGGAGSVLPEGAAEPHAAGEEDDRLEGEDGRRGHLKPPVPTPGRRAAGGQRKVGAPWEEAEKGQKMGVP